MRTCLAKKEKNIIKTGSFVLIMINNIHKICIQNRCLGQFANYTVLHFKSFDNCMFAFLFWKKTIVHGHELCVQ